MSHFFRWLHGLVTAGTDERGIVIIELQRIEQRFGLWYKTIILASGLFLVLLDRQNPLGIADYVLCGFFVLTHLAYIIVFSLPLAALTVHLESLWLTDSIIRLAFAGYVVGSRYTVDPAVILMFPLVIVGMLVGQPRLRHLAILGTASWLSYSLGAYYNSGLGGIGTSLYWREAVLNALLFVGGVVLVREVSRLTGLATTDALTQLGNRRLLDIRLRQEISRAERKRSSLSVVMLDLDNFKSINDRLGHSMGDRVLARAAEVIRNGIRDYDVACRYGGDEFVVILPDTDVSNGLSIAYRLIELVSRLTREEPLPAADVRLSASAGVATFPVHADTAEKLLQRADEALVFQAKQRKGSVALPTVIPLASRRGRRK